MVLLKKVSHSWWFDSHSRPRNSQGIHFSLSDVDERMKAMLELIEEDDDANTFTQRAEKYYKKRPELINLLEDFYRAHRSLAERFDQLKSDTRTHLPMPLDSSHLHALYRFQRLTNPDEESYDSSLGTIESQEFGESEVDDPKPEDVSGKDKDSEVMNLLKAEIERVKEENRIQKAQLMERDEEKREVIRQLSLALDILKEENTNLKKHLAKQSSSAKGASFELNKLKEVFLGKLFGGPSVPQTRLVPL